MKTDFSYQLLHKYFTLRKSNVVITLINKTILKGELVGYFKGEYETIYQWHFIPQTCLLNLAIDAFGYQQGILVKPNDILEIQFEEDNTIIKNIQ